MTEDEIEAGCETILESIDEYIEELSAEEALEVLEQLGVDIGARANGLRDDIERAGE